MAIDVRIEGAKEIEAKLGKIESKVRRKLLRQAVRASAKPIRDEAARLAPRRTSEPPRGSSEHHPLGAELHRNIKIRAASRKSQRRLGMDAGVRVRAAPQGILQEFGTVHHAADPFLRPAFDTQKATSIRVFRNFLGPKIEDEARR